MKMTNQGKGDGLQEMRLANKLTELEEMMKQLQLSLMDEKLKLNKRALEDDEDLPDNWVSMNRLHLPQCPLAKNVHSSVNRHICPVHGHTIKSNIFNYHSSPHFNTNQQQYEIPDKENYSKLISDAENFCKQDSMNEKFRELYDSSMFSPTFYRPKNPPKQVPSIDKDIDGLVQLNYAPNSEMSTYSINTNQPSKSSENISLNRNSSTSVTSRTDACSYSNQKESNQSECDSSVDLFSPFDAIVSVKNKFSDIENYVKEASVKSRSQGYQSTKIPSTPT